MSDQYHHTQLIFEGKLRTYRVPIRWRLVSGEGPKPLATWVASATFESFPVASGITDLVFEALSNPSVQVKLQNDEGELVDCSISDALDLADCGNIEISSVDLPHARVIRGHGPTSSIEI